MWYNLIVRYSQELNKFVSFNVERERVANMVTFSLFLKLLIAAIMAFCLGCMIGALLLTIEQLRYERQRHKKVLEAIDSVTKGALNDVGSKSED